MYGAWGYYKKPEKIPDDKLANLQFSEVSDSDLFSLRWSFVFDDPSAFAPVSRDNIVGIDHVLNELDKHIRLIKNFTYLNDKSPELDTGMVFSGPPGSGKTYCARYMASESEARFINVSDFPRRKGRFISEDIHVLFRLLRTYVQEKNKPIVAFWDEFDTFTNTGEDSEKMDALARFKTELSGIQGKLRGVFIIAATNQPHLIPADITRGGRLGKRIRFNALKRKAKQNVFRHFVLKHDHADNIDFESLSYLISAHYPADIEEVVNDAWRNANLETLGSDVKPCLTDAILVSTLLKQVRGSPDDIVLSDEELQAIAIYEIGRALVARTLKFPAQLIAIERSGYPDAYRISEVEHFSAYMPLERICDGIAIKYGGIIAQDLSGIKPNNKQIDDFNEITEMAQRYVEQLRLAKFATDFALSTLAVSRTEQRLPSLAGVSDDTMYKNIAEIEKLLKNQQERTRSILNHYGPDMLKASANLLIIKGHLLQTDIDSMLDPTYSDPKDNSPKPKKIKKNLGF